MIKFSFSKKGRHNRGRPAKRKNAVAGANPLHAAAGENDDLAGLFGTSDIMEIMGKFGGRSMGDGAKAGIMAELTIKYGDAKKNGGIENTEQWLAVALKLKDFSTAAEICLNLRKFHDAEQNLIKSEMTAKDAASKIADFCASKGFFNYAAEYCKRAGRFMEAGLLFTKLERHRAAVLCYEKAGSDELASEANGLADQALHQRQ